MLQTNIVEILPADQARTKASRYCSARRWKQEAEWTQSGVILVAIKRASGTMRFNPTPDEKIEAGDRLIAGAETGPLKEIERRMSGDLELPKTEQTGS